MPAALFSRLTPASASLWLLAILCTAAFVLRCVGLSGRWLWYDELLSVHFSAHGLWAALLVALRFDVHPPLYYLQLSLWALPSRDDVWLMLNTVVWSTAAVAALAYCTQRIHGWRVGLVAGLLLAVTPAALAYSDQVRMYSLLMVVIVWVWYAQQRWIGTNAGKAGLLAVIASQLIIVYTHSAGVIMLSGPVLFAFFNALETGRRDLLRRWVLAEALVAVLGLPAVGFALLREVGHTIQPSLDNIVDTWGFLLTGDLELPLWAAVATGVFSALLVVWAYSDARLRLHIATLVAAPILIALAISYTLKPIWLPRVFMTTVPFICLTLALALTPRGDAASVKWRWAPLAAIVAFWAAVGLTQQLTRVKGDGYKPAATLVHGLTRPGDLVLVDGHFPYWSFLWYYAGPDWGRPQQAFVLNPKWAALERRLPSGTMQRLGFGSADSKLERQGVTIMLWDRNQLPPDSPAQLVVVRTTDSPTTTLPGRRMQDRVEKENVAVERWTR